MDIQYELIPLDTYSDNLHNFFSKDAREKIETKVKKMLSTNPYRYSMLKGKITVKGVKLAGLRHIKTGVKGIKGGAYVLYRICEECLRNEYYIKSGVRCQFCDDQKLKRIVLFDVHPRSFGYR